jgi:hypothetical protein
MKRTTKCKEPDWKHLPNYLTEAEIKIELNWSADHRTRQAIERQAALMGFESPTAYSHQALAATVASNEEDTILTNDGRILSVHPYDANGTPMDV